MQRSRVAYKAVTSIGWRISYSLSFRNRCWYRASIHWRNAMEFANPTVVDSAVAYFIHKGHAITTNNGLHHKIPSLTLKEIYLIYLMKLLSNL